MRTINQILPAAAKYIEYTLRLTVPVIRVSSVINSPVWVVEESLVGGSVVVGSVGISADTSVIVVSHITPSVVPV